MTADRILHIGFDCVLSDTRRMLLEQRGYLVASVFGKEEAAALLLSEGLDLIMVCHSAKKPNRREIVRECRTCAPSTPVLALLRPHESFEEADCQTEMDEPEQWLRAVESCLEAA
jgi:DNA-binding response OmpR family regulator